MPATPNPAIQRRSEGPWVLVEVPMDDDDWDYPSRRRFYGKLGPVEHLSTAVQFTDLKEARRVANKRMFLFRNTWVEVVPLPIAWAIAHASTASWTTKVPRPVWLTYRRPVVQVEP